MSPKWASSFLPRRGWESAERARAAAVFLLTYCLQSLKAFTCRDNAHTQVGARFNLCFLKHACTDQDLLCVQTTKNTFLKGHEPLF